MDLIPADFRQTQWAKRFVRSIARTVFVVVLLCTVTWLFLNYQIKQAEQEIQTLREQDGSSKQQQAELNQLRLNKQQTEQQINALAMLRGGKQVTSLLLALDRAYQQGVWLNRVALHAAEAANPAKNGIKAGPGLTPTGALPNTEPPNGQVAEINGHATDHQRLAKFLTILGQQPGIKNVTLIDTKTKDSEAAEVLEFSASIRFNPNGVMP